MPSTRSRRRRCAWQSPGDSPWSRRRRFPETFFTVWTNLFDRGGLKAGESVLIHGGTSGIGTTAIQLAHAWGARGVRDRGQPREGARLRARCAAPRGIDYHAEDFVEIVRAETGGKGVDVILDMVGAAYLARNLDAAAMEGRLVVILAHRRRPRRDQPEHTQASKRLTVTRLDTAHPQRRPEGDRRRGSQAQRVAAHRGGSCEAGHSCDIPPRAGERCSPPDGELHAHRQDRADDLNWWKKVACGACLDGKLRIRRPKAWLWPAARVPPAQVRRAADGTQSAVLANCLVPARTGRPRGPGHRCRSCRPRGPSAIPAWS